MNRLRQRGGVRISFFSFQDIITSVTGILILVTLMLSFSLRLDEEPEERKAEKKLQEQRQRLTEVERENALMQRRKIEATMLPDPLQVRVQLEALRTEVAQVTKERERSEETLKALRERIARSTPSMELREEVVELERRMVELREKLAKEKTNSNVLFVIPDPETQRAEKRPVAMVVSSDTLKAQRIGGAGALETPIASGETVRAMLRQFDPAREFVVFYFRPSGAKWFDAFREETRRAGFEVGYDAVEEQKEVVFSAQ